MSGDETFKSILANFALDLITKKGFVSRQELKSALLDAGHEQAKLGTFTGYLDFNRTPYDSPFGESGIHPNVTKAGHKNGTLKGLCFRDFDDEIETDEQYGQRVYMFTSDEWKQTPRTKPAEFSDKTAKNSTVDTTEETSAGETEETDKERIKELLDRLPELTPEDKTRILGGEGE